MIIRDMVVDDIYRGYLDCLETLAPVNLTFVEAIKVFKARSLSITTLVAVEEETGNVMGTLSLLIEPKFIHEGGLVGHIEDVAVATEYQGQGVGSALLKAALEFCRGTCYRVRLNCSAKLVSYYEKLGFAKYEDGMRLNLSH